jgi:organic hydroperoxide reductase OsmC/OhrA
MATFSRQAVLEWNGDVMSGAGQVTAGRPARLRYPPRFRALPAEATGKTTPEELPDASHATCCGIGLRSLIGRRGGQARRLTVTATITAEKGPGGIRIQSSHLRGEVESLEGIDHAQLHEIAQETRQRCYISIALEGRSNRHGNRGARSR